jgi:hypothetical protein
MIRYAEYTAITRLNLGRCAPAATLRWSQNIKSLILKYNPSPLMATLKNMSFNNNWGPSGGEGKGEGEIQISIVGAI